MQVVLVFVFQVGFLTVYIVLSNVCRMCIEQYVEKYRILSPILLVDHDVISIDVARIFI